MLRLITRPPVVFLLLITLTQCVEPVSFPIEGSKSSSLIVYGQFNDVEEPHYLYLSEATSGEESSAPVIDATAALVDEEGNTYPYVHQKDGQYLLQEIAKGEPGKSYHVEIEARGRTYRSEPETMPYLFAADSLFYSISEEAYAARDGKSPLVHHLSTYAKSFLPETDQKYFLRWEVDEVFYWNLTFFPNPFNVPPPDCFVLARPDPQRVTLLDGTAVKAPTAINLVSVQDVNQNFLNRHYIVVRQLSITESAHDFWRRIGIFREQRIRFRHTARGRAWEYA
jgi:hypothetical protein